MRRLFISMGLMLSLSILNSPALASQAPQSQNESAIEVLQRTVNTFNTSKAPTLMSNGMQITKMELTDKELIYHINIEGSNVNIKTLKAGRKTLRKTLLQQYSQSNVQDSRSTIPYCRQAGIGVVYNYFNAKGKTLKISFKSSEI